MNRDKVYIFVILLLLAVIFLQPGARSLPVSALKVSMPESSPVAAPEPKASCVTDQLALAADAECRAQAKVLADPLTERAHSLEKQVKDTFAVLADTWNRVGKARVQPEGERELIVKLIKSEVLDSCRK